MPEIARKDQNDDDRLKEFINNQCQGSSGLALYLPDTLNLCDSLDTALHIFDLLIELPNYSEGGAGFNGGKWIESVKVVVNYIKITGNSKLLPLLTEKIFDKEFRAGKDIDFKHANIFKTIDLPFPHEY